MNKYQEALDIISDTNTMNLLTVGERSLTKPLVAILQELVDKEKPLKPYSQNMTSQLEGANSYRTSEYALTCRRCDNTFLQDSVMEGDYCCYCGQRIDWKG